MRARKAEEALRVLRACIAGVSHELVEPKFQEKLLDIIAGVIE